METDLPRTLPLGLKEHVEIASIFFLITLIRVLTETAFWNSEVGYARILILVGFPIGQRRGVVNVTIFLNMILNDYRIQQLSIADNLIVPYDKARLQPHSIDLTLGNEFLFPSSRNTSGQIYNEEDNEWVESREEESIAIPPFAFVLAHTVETLTIPQNLVGIVQGKSTIGRRGLQIECAGLIDAGFSGQITLELFNMAPYIIKLKIGMPICQVKFFEGESAKLVDYRQVGHYCGQRGATPPHSIKPFN